MAVLLKGIYGQEKGPLKKLLPQVTKKKLPHAILFSGPSGVGKAKTAWAIAQVLLCEKEDLACGECISCKKVENKTHSSILSIQPDGAYIKVSAITEISQFLSLQSFSSARVVIIDSAHQMNMQTSNGILKILEEPPENVYFILVSSHAEALPLTIRSRTQRMAFYSLSIEDMKNILSSQGFEEVYDHPADSWILTACRGRMDYLEKWKNKKEQRELAFELFRKCVLEQELCAFSDLADQVKNREQALFVCLCWQQLLRDSILQNFAKHQVIHRDQQKILKLLSKKSFFILSDWFQKMGQLEKDLASFVDAPLAFDHFFLSVREN